MGGFGITPVSDPFRTPPPLTESQSAFVYYGTFGLLDPKMPVEAWIFGGGSFIDEIGFALVAPTAVGFVEGAAISIVVAFVVTGSVGWALDPDHRRSGGADEWVKDASHYVPSDLGYGMRMF
jgi:hypothetical protein